ncbi:MAG: hypothetical protein VKK62_03625 [Synechococcaceae cyanobacterium]|nr:hypothetical protein [Synechococcaceae cyanobacterium]
MAADDRGFRYLEAQDAYVLELDPRRVGFGLLEGWDREQQAYDDRSALAFVSGPMYERHVDAGGREQTVPLGEIKLGEQLWRGRNRSAARERAYVGIRRDGQVDFGYGELTPQRARTYETFIGGLHSIYNDLQAPPPGYKGAYSLGMGQQIRYYLPRIRVVYGLRPDGRLEMLMSRDGLTLEQTRALARQRQLLAAYLPDHASKSRLIVPGIKPFSAADANWISGGATSFVHVPYMLRLQTRATPLQGSLLTGLGQRLPEVGCRNPLECGQRLGGRLLDRALAGFNRLIEEGVAPVAQLLWAPRGPALAQRDGQRAPLREPLITADPGLLRLRQQQESLDRPSGPTGLALAASRVTPVAPDLPPPDDARMLEAEAGAAGDDPAKAATAGPAPRDGESGAMPESAAAGGSATTAASAPGQAAASGATGADRPLPQALSRTTAVAPPPPLPPLPLSAPPTPTPPPPLPAATATP